jgi:hypothetical protein
VRDFLVPFRTTGQTQIGGLAHFGATVVFWLAAGVGLGKAEDFQSEVDG